MAVVGSDIGSGGLSISGTGVANFVSAGSVDSDIEVVWDFDNDGDFDEAIEDITTYVLDLQTTMGRDYPNQFSGKVTPGRLRMTLDNSDDRFNRFADTPLVGGGLSLDTGRKIRVRTAGAPETEPTLLAHDSFDGPAGATPTADELGNAWSVTAGGMVFDGAGSLIVADSVNPGQNIAVMDVGVSDYYIQITAGLHTRTDATTGIIYRYQDPDNYGMFRLVRTGLVHTVRQGGVNVRWGRVRYAPEHGQTIGIRVEGGKAHFFADGMRVFTTAAFGTTETQVGLRGFWSGQVIQTATQFSVWDRMHHDREEVNVFTGVASKIQPIVSQDGSKIAKVEASGVLSRLASHRVEQPPWGHQPMDPDGPVALSQDPTPGGRLVGFMAGGTGLLQPPVRHGLAKASTALGSVALESGTALARIREIEETERAVLWEDESGKIRYDTQMSIGRSQGTWTDAAPGQFVFETIELTNYEREVVNRVRPALSPVTPEIRRITGAEDAHTTPMPAVFTVASDAVDGDLVIVIFLLSGATTGELWIAPPGWLDLRPWGDNLGVRIFGHIVNNDQGDAYTFYLDTGSAGGPRHALHVYFRAGTWFGDIVEGVVVAINGVGDPNTLTESRAGDVDQPSILWDRTWPSAFMALRTGITATSPGGSVDVLTGDDRAPDGYHLAAGRFTAGTTDANDVGHERGHRVGVTPVERPGEFTSTFENFDLVDAITIAVRGFDGDPPGSGQTITVEDKDAQVLAGSIIDHPGPGALFPDEASARDYGRAVLADHAKDKPLFRVSFTANKSSQYREKALARVRDQVTLNLTGAKGFVVDNEVYIIENVQHRLSQGNKHWKTTWELSPAGFKGEPDVPIGEIKVWPTGTAPADHLLCDGAAVSRTTYAALFATIGTDYGVGDGSTTFNVPDLGGVGSDPQEVTSFNPELKADTTDPTLGSGSSVTGFYQYQRGSLHMWGIIDWGTSGTAGGSGNYYIPLPSGYSTATGATAAVSCGEAQLTESGVGTTLGHTVLETSVDAIRMIVPATVAPTVPFTWGASDRIRFSAIVPVDPVSGDVDQYIIKAF